MPVALDSTQFITWSKAVRDGEWLAGAIRVSLDAIDGAMKVPRDTGKTEAAFASRSPVVGMGLSRSGGIGNMTMVGDPFAPAPKATISQFLQWYRKG